MTYELARLQLFLELANLRMRYAVLLLRLALVGQTSALAAYFLIRAFNGHISMAADRGARLVACGLP